MNRKVLYGYQVQDGELIVHPQEFEGVKRIFSLYLAGMTHQQIADTLSAEGFVYSAECLAWTRNRITRVLQNPRYMGEKGHPALIDGETFRMAQTLRSERARKWGDHPALRLTRKLRCANCGHSLRRIAERQWKDTLRFHCDGCGAKITISDDALLAEVERQAVAYEPTVSAPYVPSEDTVRLTNAINRGLEHPDRPEDVTALIMQGISARYACFSTQMTSADILRLLKEKAYDQAIQYITISADNAVTVAFK